MQKRIAFAVVTLLVFATAQIVCAQQDKNSRPSPPESTKCDLPGGKTIAVDYSSPRMKGRKVFGDLVPYGKVWRTGANEATTFVTGEDLTAGGKNIPAGSYTMFTVPQADKWTLIINKHTGEWGIPYKYESEELARIPMTVTKTAAPVEEFKISFDQSSTGCTMHISWENTEASVAFNAKK